MIDVRKADSAYSGILSFSKWRSCTVDEGRLVRYSEAIANLAEASDEELRRARDVAKRAAAIDTGAIEGLYEVDRGFTFTVATQSAMWESALQKRGEETRALIESQMEGYDYVLDFATASQPIAEVWVRTLHEVMCSPQKTYLVYTEAGPQQQALPLGEYKRLPNHVVQQDGVVHSYAPVDMTGAEMSKYCVELRSKEFEGAHPVLQAAYAHHALTMIHPFSDGNGRVARALASVFTYRAYSIPSLILVDNRPDYIAALEAADDEAFQSLVDFMLARTLDAMLLVQDCLRAAKLPSADDAATAIKELYITRGGFTHEQVDRAGLGLLTAVREELTALALKHSVERQLGISVSKAGGIGGTPQDSAYRWPSGHNQLLISLKTYPPADASLQRVLRVAVPRDCGRDDDLIVSDGQSQQTLVARVGEAMSTISTVLHLRIKVFAEEIISSGLIQVRDAAEASLKR